MKQLTTPVHSALLHVEIWQIVEALEKSSTLRKFRENPRIISVGDASHAAYLLLNGSAYTFTDDDDGKEFNVSTFGPGNCFEVSCLSLMDGYGRLVRILNPYFLRHWREL